MTSWDRNTQEVTEREELPGHGYRGGRGTETGAAMHTINSLLMSKTQLKGLFMSVRIIGNKGHPLCEHCL